MKENDTKSFVDLPIWELLNDSTYSGKEFFIPSYQRGYRWESKQVEDLLHDLEEFVASTDANYYLQPLVVRPNHWKDNNGLSHEVWEVLDGQQRLTTLLLLLRCLNEKNPQPSNLYKIIYDRQNDNLNFSKISYDPNSEYFNYPDKKINPDCFYVANAKSIIQKWYDAHMKDSASSILSNILSSLTKRDSKQQVRFIWYDASFEEDFKAMQSIALFNRLNGGKISLTGSELVKALFYLGIEYCSDDVEMRQARFSMEWDSIERKLQEDEFWNFICPTDSYRQTRMDLLLDFTRKNMSVKGDASYRWYQDTFNQTIFRNDKKKAWDKWVDLWKDIKDHFDILTRWFENPVLYNHIGYMVENGVYIQDIQPSNLNTYNVIRTKVFKKDEEKGFALDGLFELRYNENYSLLKKLLLLFNIETYCRHNIRFPFHLYKAGYWDVEHVNSQTENIIQKPQERESWIENHALECLERDKEDPKAKDLYERGKQLLDNHVPSKDFAEYRTEVGKYYLDNNSLEKDSIGNLTLLNSSINRSYGNALFPTKKLTIATCDQMGEFIPLCTRYLFLKYYSSGINATRMNVMRWSEQDQLDYQETIKEYLTSYFA